MKEHVFENPVELRTAAPAPHFDDRRVVQRAQRVVPLDEIRTRLRLRRLLFFGGAFAIAIILGAASALMAVYVKRISAGKVAVTEEQPAPETPAPDTSAAMMADGALTSSDQPATELVSGEVPEQPIVKAATAARRQVPPLAERPRVVGNRETLTRRDEVRPSEQEQLEQIRESVLYDQWQERRLRRAARRERRNRDLSRVDELFEGPRLPERP